MIVSINQPAYLPWMGYFDRIKKSDLHIVLDHVQFEKGSFTNRCLIRQRDGRVMWLTVPVEKGKPINETLTIGRDWIRKHRESLRQAYGDEAASVVWFGSSQTLSHACANAMYTLEPRIQPPKSYSFSSMLGGSKLGAKSELVLNLCKEVGASTYLSGPHGRDYLDLPSFEKAGIEVAWHDYPVKQPVLSAVHDLFS